MVGLTFENDKPHQRRRQLQMPTLLLGILDRLFRRRVGKLLNILCPPIGRFPPRPDRLNVRRIPALSQLASEPKLHNRMNLSHDKHKRRERYTHTSTTTVSANLIL